VYEDAGALLDEQARGAVQDVRQQDATGQTRSIEAVRRAGEGWRFA